MPTTKPLRIGSGAGFAGDRLEPALVLAERGKIDWLALECLGERTVALAQLRKRRDATSGYDPMLLRRMEILLPFLRRKGIRLISNFGAANPLAAGEAIVALARRMNIPIKIAVLTGDDVLEKIGPDHVAIESGLPIEHYGALISANAYLGAEAILPAIRSGADVIVTGRVADPSLFVAPIAHHFRWSTDDLDRLSAATVVGHLLECAGQLCGGYFADPGVKDVPDMAHLGFPFADVSPDGDAILGKVDGTGGLISMQTVKEQLLYEVTDPAAYLTPDVTVDFRSVALASRGENRIHVSGARASGKSATLKVSIGYLAGYLGEGEISYAGQNALARSTLAGAIIRERLDGAFEDLRIDHVGSDSSHGRSFDASKRPYEVRLRVAARASNADEAARVGEEIEALYTNGPAGGGGTRKSVSEQIGIVSTLIDRSLVSPVVTIKEYGHEPATL